MDGGRGGCRWVEVDGGRDKDGVSMKIKMKKKIWGIAKDEDAAGDRKRDEVMEIG